MSDDGRTHWEGCYAAVGHHLCAIARVAELEAREARLLSALEEIRGALDAAGGDTDPPGDPEEWREDYPNLWACYRASRALTEPTNTPQTGDAS